MRTVFGADEQSEVEVDVLRWVRLARMVLDQERVPEESEMSVIFVDEQAMSDLHERFLGGSGPTDVLAFPMDDDVAPGGRQPDQGGRGPGSPAEAADPPTVIGDVVVCPQVARRQTGAQGSLDDEVFQVAGSGERLRSSLANRLQQRVDGAGQLGLDLDVANFTGAIPRLQVVDFVAVLGSRRSFRRRTRTNVVAYVRRR